ncbi:PAP2-like protein, putative [Plasmodium knowlesi strain H]|uniref:PAP2-like protein, putative n=3 Tax=Plasmodium knowlesi TaxID=5850 RepID=A0A5K1VDI2_PLAKH|nr:phosphatidic acid phosphatase 2, putative [Plasmodium knowlesi strain H]OTN68681.1 putative PAP2-like protein [Plasmodium knowlesi]CAA9986214.1 phosphatidic acid phosphatase 2, putative [Plasmodium knowlesi strain H]SBO25422.1 PAP2-like protein, putative [Plasmodium knowlesi strain H]SBO27706.1 PAP2-like protein, putative [Plasmodium knowlesi strain H]VVS75688.1 phosphatidic acid phosphatase 2, putative [Plasmodium knowlesi strain H]|eukprot:XP_002257623.1 phosphatase, putative [Plasmodium knowlesi strain H]
MITIYAPTLLTFGQLITTARCINLASFLSFWGWGGISPPDQNGTEKNNKNGQDTEKLKKQVDDYLDEKIKINLRSKKMSYLKPIFINPETEIHYYLRSDGNYDELYAKYPLCEAKYKIADKLKGLSIFQKIMNNNKKLALLKTCIMEMYGLLYVTLRNTNDIFSVVATVYGYIPYAFMLATLLGFLLTSNNMLLYFVFIIPTQLTINDIILKNILKMSRPIHSALQSYGMPSGHSSFSFSLLTFLILHLLEAKKDKWTIMACILAIILLLPIPWSRVYIQDHTLYQVIFGSLLGFIIGVVFYMIKKQFLKQKDNTK